MNIQKLCVFFSANTPRALATELGNVLDILLVSDLGSYLGIPALWGQSKCSGLAYVKGRLLGKLQGWKRCTLSPTGREVLIKVVAQALPQYSMHLFKFLNTICHELDSLIATF
ncbi:hypothetical protein COP2_013179 [Malus domestica]